MNTSSLILAIEGGCGADCKSGQDAFWGSLAGQTLGKLLAVAGIIVVIVAVLKVFGKVTSGKVGEAVKVGLGAALFAAFLFNPQLIGTLISLFSGLIGTVINSFGDVAGVK